MVAVAFEADIVSEFLRIPNFEQFKNKHVRVVIEAEEVSATRSVLPKAFTQPLQVAEYVAMDSRDAWHSRD
jgi:hypothetical protein